MRSKTAPWLLLAPFMVLFLGTVIVPIIMAIGYSFTRVERSGLLGEEGVTSVFAGFENYAAALANQNFIASTALLLPMFIGSLWLGPRTLPWFVVFVLVCFCVLLIDQRPDPLTGHTWSFHDPDLRLAWHRRLAPAIRCRWQGQEVSREYGKMGKSLKNAVAPDDMYEEYGADTLRVYEMSMGPLDTSRPWATKDVVGAHRFLQRLWRVAVDEETGEVRVTDEAPGEDVLKALHKTIAGVNEHYAALRNNTAAAKLIEYTNHLTKEGVTARAAGPEAVAEADVVVTCTAATAPLFDGTLVPEHATVVAMGSHTTDARETDDALARRATVAVESRDSAAREDRKSVV